MINQSRWIRAAFWLLVLFSPAIASAQDVAMTFQLARAQSCRDKCPTEIVGEGTITLESAGAFRAAAARFSSGSIVVRLNSIGGNLVGGLELGNALRQMGATTEVGKGARCVSACAYAFLGGTRRSVTGGRIGIHNFRPDESASVNDFPDALVQHANVILKAYVAHLDVDQRLVELSASVPSTTIRYLDDAELRRFRVVNGHLRKAQEGDSAALDLRKDKVVFQPEMKNSP
jgi:hypothetical protein